MASLSLPLPAARGPCRLDPRVKLAWTVGLLVVSSALPAGAWSSWGVLLGGLLVALRWSRTPWKRVVRRSLLAAPFLLAALPLVLRPDGWPRLQWLVARAWLSAQAVAWLVATTPFEEILGALRWVRIPEVFVTVLALLWRYLFLLAEEGARMVRARDARTPGRLRYAARTTGRMAGTLLVRTLDRAHRVQLAMLARGYRPGVAVRRLEGLDRRSWTALGVAGVVLALAAGVCAWRP